MTYFNPLIAPVAQGPQARRAAAEKGRQVARAQALSKNTAAEGDRFDHQVESANGLTPVGDDPSKDGQPRQQRDDPRDGSARDRRGDGGDGDAPAQTPHIDVTG